MLAPLRGLRPLHFTNGSSGSGTFFTCPCSFFWLSWQLFMSSHRISFEQRLAVEPATHTCACSRDHHGGAPNAGCASAKPVRTASPALSCRPPTRPPCKNTQQTPLPPFTTLANPPI